MYKSWQCRFLFQDQLIGVPQLELLHQKEVWLQFFQIILYNDHHQGWQLVQHMMEVVLVWLFQCKHFHHFVS